ncbi:MAG: hypothetical protein ACKVOU_04950 [Cytophagales bacterium]
MGKNNERVENRNISKSLNGFAWAYGVDTNTPSYPMQFLQQLLSFMTYRKLRVKLTYLE